MFEVVRKLPIDTQIELVELCREVVRQAPLFRKVMPTGAEFRYLCTSAGDYGWIVITSYSIHYTKLYENGGVANLQSRNSGQ